MILRVRLPVPVVRGNCIQGRGVDLVGDAGLRGPFGGRSRQSNGVWSNAELWATGELFGSCDAFIAGVPTMFGDARAAWAARWVVMPARRVFKKAWQRALEER